MNTSALIMMLVAEGIVTIMTVYYFVKVLRTPPRNPEHDSYSET